MRCRTANRGHSYVDPRQMRRHVTDLDAAGFQVHVHAIGDRAVRESLEAFAAARAANGRATTATTSHTSRSCTQTTSHGSPPSA